MSAEQKTLRVKLPRLHEAQARVVSEARRWNVLACGRRFGKTTLLIDRLVHPALQGYPVAWFSPTYKMLAEVWREMREVLTPVVSRFNAQEHRLELITGGILDMWSLDAPDSARGRKYKRGAIDEAAMVPSLQDAIQKVIRPTLTDYEGDLWMGSTPTGMNFFQQMYAWGQDPFKRDWASWQLPTVANPFINPEEVEKARQELPEAVFDQEYLAQFIRNEGAVFRNIRANMTAPGGALPADHDGHTLVAGVDWAQKHDFTAISVGCADCMEEVELDRFNQIGWSLQRGRLVALIERWNVGHIEAEQNSIGGPNIEALQEEGLPIVGFDTTAASKPPLIKSLALSLEREEFRFLENPQATAELEGYEAKVNPVTNRTTYSAPAGMNDDTVIARALLRRAVEMGGTGHAY